MLFRETIKLIAVTNSTNAIGDPIKVLTPGADVFADKQSIRQSEFYQSAAVGLKPDFTFIIRKIEYNQEQMIQYKAKNYNVARIYEREDDFIELTASGTVNGVI